MLKPGQARHVQISDWLRDRIADGTYGADDRLPSESEIGEQFGVSRITVRRALQTLEHEGLIYRRQGLGSFVQGRPVRQGLVRLADFVEDMAEAGLRALSEVVYWGAVDAPAEVVDALGLEEATRVFRLDRVRLGDDEPIAFDRTWIPAFYARLLEPHDLTRETIYHILERRYDVPVVSGRYRITAANAPAEVAARLRIAEGEAVLRVDRISLTEHDRGLYVQHRFYRPDRVAYELDLFRDPNADASDGFMLRDFEPVIRPDAPPGSS